MDKFRNVDRKYSDMDNSETWIEYFQTWNNSKRGFPKNRNVIDTYISTADFLREFEDTF